MLRWMCALLLAAAARGAEPSPNLLTSDLFLLPPGELALRPDAQPQTDRRSGFGIYWRGQRTGRLSAEDGVWTNLRTDLEAGRPEAGSKTVGRSLNWLPASLDSRELIRSGWSREDAQRLAVAATQRLWPDFAQVDEISQLHTYTQSGSLDRVGFAVRARPHPDCQLSATVEIWPWGRRVVDFARADPVVGLPVRPRVDHDRAIALARDALGQQAPRATRGTVSSYLSRRADRSGKLAWQWEIAFEEETIAGTGP